MQCDNAFAQAPRLRGYNLETKQQHEVMMRAQPICFMIMPYGTKPTQQGAGSTAPPSVNFDLLWDAAIRPAIERLGYDAVRADQDLGALIIHEMIERLAISDLVVAEMSIPNGNVYYEVGIRHAAKSQGCVMISADWAQPLFDVAQMRQIRYPLPLGEVDGTAAAAIQDCLEAKIPALADGTSPFYTVLPGFPDKFDPALATAFKKALEQLSAFQAAVSAARSSPAGECQRQALELCAQYTDVPIQNVVALDLLYLLRDCTDWPTTLKFIGQLPPAIRDMPLVMEQKALAQSKAGDHMAAIGGLLQLIALRGDTSERRGLLGGRYKALSKSTAQPAQKERYLDEAIHQYDLGMHLDLNDYYPASNLARLYRTRNMRGDDARAKVAAAVALTACERARQRPTVDRWLKPTLLGAAFDSGDVEIAQQLADEIRREGPVEWQLKTTIPDLELAIAFQTEGDAAALKKILVQLKELTVQDAVSAG